MYFIFFSFIIYLYVAQQRLYCLNMLRRSKLAPVEIIQIYASRIRPVLEYASPAWHAGFTVEQSDAIENIQKRALRIAFPDLEYEDACQQASTPLLRERRISQCKALFAKMQDPSDKLNRILPPLRENVRNTRCSMKYKPPKVHTERFKNTFLPFVLFNCQ